MLHSPTHARLAIEQDIMDQVQIIAPRFAERAEAAEQARRIPGESVQEMLAAGLARILVPTRILAARSSALIAIQVNLFSEGALLAPQWLECFAPAGAQRE